VGSISLFASVIDWGWLLIGPPYIYITIGPVIVLVGPFALHWYGLMYGVAILMGFFVAQRYATRRGITKAIICRTLWWCIAAGLIG
jgi:phosphatidylglycerol---prolipoprotein diacylglyceryl transferase